MRYGDAARKINSPRRTYAGADSRSCPVGEEAWKMNIGFLIAFMVCLVGYVFHTVMHILEYRGSELAKSKNADATMALFITAGYIGWGFMMYTDPIKMDVRNYIAAPLGLLIGLTGLIMLVLSTIAKKGFHELDHLVTKGIYSKLRNPMYLGIILMHIGFPLASRSLLTLLTTAMWTILILLWKYMEEQDLEKKFGAEYLEYKGKTFF